MPLALLFAHAGRKLPALRGSAGLLWVVLGMYLRGRPVALV
jgi:hypothetical protein